MSRATHSACAVHVMGTQFTHCPPWKTLTA